MLREAIASAPTVEEAIDLARKELGISDDVGEMEILEYPEKKKLGLFGGKDAKVRVTYDDGKPEPKQPKKPVKKAESPQKAEEKPAKKQKSEKKPEKAKKPNWFARTGKRIAAWFRGMKSELKKVVWPTRKQTLNNVIVSVVVMVAAGVVIWAFDQLAMLIVNSLMRIGG